MTSTCNQSGVKPSPMILWKCKSRPGRRGIYIPKQPQCGCVWVCVYLWDMCCVRSWWNSGRGGRSCLHSGPASREGWCCSPPHSGTGQNLPLRCDLDTQHVMSSSAAIWIRTNGIKRWQQNQHLICLNTMEPVPEMDVFWSPETTHTLN